MKKLLSRRAKRARTRRTVDAMHQSGVPGVWERLRDRRLVDLTVADLFDLLDAWRAEPRSGPADGFLTSGQLAEALGVKPDTVRKWVTRWGAPHVRFGRQIRFNLAQVRAWSEERAEAAGSWSALHVERARTITSTDED